MTFVASITTAITALLDTLARRRQASRTAQVLRSLDDRTLRDIGLGRDAFAILDVSNITR